MSVLIAGGGIAGLTLGLTLEQIGIKCRIFEAAAQIKPMGVGINLQPNAVRELYDLGLKNQLNAIGVATQTLGFYTKFGLEIWSEPRGVSAGYNWPQMSLHRGQLQMMLYQAFVERAGRDAICTGHRALGFTNNEKAITLHLDGPTGPVTATGDILIAGDGIHSALRAQIFPNEGAPVWGGAILWRGTTVAEPFLKGADMILAGHDTQRFVAYPISNPDPETGQNLINWIAELRVDPATPWRKEDWNRYADPADFLPKFENWGFDWLNIPELIHAAQTVFEYPMVDRDPVPFWTTGAMTLMGDAAHPTYPVGSNGASQAIIDARIIGANVQKFGATSQALKTYETHVRPRTSAVTLANRGTGPDAILQQVEDLCGGTFDNIEDVMSRHDLAEHSARYKKLAGFDVQTLNAQPAIIGARTNHRETNT